MKAELEDIPSIQGNSSFYVTHLKVSHFQFRWHFHPEFELTYIVRGSGYRIVGNSHAYFSAGDFVLLGNNLPHTWSSKQDDNSQSEAIVIQFSNEFIAPFLQLNESAAIRKLLAESSRGLSFQFSDELASKMTQITSKTGFDSVLSLLEILEKLTGETAHQIASTAYHNTLSQKFESRINKVCLFLQAHFSEPISLQQVADLVFMSESNFCKFFKKATSTTFSDYLNDLRINEACNLLLYTDLDINKIAHSCGFESLSYFNRVFLKKKNMTPSLFRRH